MESLVRFVGRSTGLYRPRTEIQRRSGLGILVIVPAVLSASSLGVSYWLVRRVRRRRNQARLIRAHQGGESSHFQPGEYVLVTGTVDSPNPLTSPDKGVSCVRYEKRTLRLVDQRIGATKWKHGVHSNIGRGFLSLFGGISNLFKPSWWTFGGGTSHSRESSKEKWGMEYQEVTASGATSSIIHVTNAESGVTFLLDLEGAEFLELETVTEDFQQAAPQDAGSDGRRALGYKTVEKVLRVGTPLVILAEVGVNAGSASGKASLTLHQSTPSNMLDLKTNSIVRPFVVSTQSESKLLHDIEKSGRYYFWSAVPCIAAAVSMAYAAYSAYEPDSLQWSQMRTRFSPNRILNQSQSQPVRVQQTDPAVGYPVGYQEQPAGIRTGYAPTTRR